MWNKVQFGFDAEDETVNFGSRQMAVFEKSVYETSTVAIISRDECDGPREAPKIRCTKYYGPDPGIVVIVDETVIILGLEASGIKNKFLFDALVDSYVVKRDGSLLIVALNNGDVFGFLLQTSENPIFLKNVCNPNSENKNTFVGTFLHDFGDVCELIITAYSGNIYTLKGISVTELSKACLNNSKDSVNDVIEHTKLDYISTSDFDDEYHNILHSLELGEGDDRRMLLLVQTRVGQELQLWSADFKEVCSLRIEFDGEHCRLKKLIVPKNESLIYGLTDKGSVLSVCPYTLTALHHQNSVEWSNAENLLGEDGSFLVLRTGSHSALELVQMPEFSVKFQMDVNKNTHLAENQPLDDLLYLEAIATANDVQEISSIHVKMISESQPEYRLERILRRGKFDEAEGFARRFNLSVETVRKAHLQKLSNDIQPWASNSASTDESGRFFKELLHKVEDTEFVARCSMNAISSDFQLMVDVLKYAKDRIKISLLDRENRDCSKLQQLYKEIRLILLKLNTFFVISERSFNVDDWLSFSKANLIEVCQQFLRQGKLRNVALIWNRHIPSVRHQLSLDQVTSFFRNIPHSLPLSSILEWLAVLLPTVIDLYPKIIISVVNWCKEKVNNMELLAEPNWIDNSIQFLKDVLVIIREDRKLCGTSTLGECEYLKLSPIKDALFYIRILTEMSIMKKDHEVNISIREYTQENAQEVIFSVLDRVPVEELDRFMRGFFKKLLVRGNLNSDVIISEYILNLVETSVNWWYWEEAPWESRVDILLNYILGVQEKLETVLTVLKYSPVPWSPIITRICDESLKHDNPTSRLILEQKRMINCKLILKKYDLKEITLIQPHFRKIVLNIFSKKRNTMLEDALQIAETFDSKLCVEVYKLYVQQIIENENVEKAIAFLDDTNLPPSVVVTCCENIILRTNGLSHAPIFASKLENYIQILDMAYSKLMQMSTKTNSSPVISKYVCKQLKDVYFIKKNYTKNVRNSNFTNQKEKDELLKLCLNVLLEDIKLDKTRLTTLGIKLRELANCLECSLGEVSLQFTLLGLTENRFDIVVFMLRLLLSEEKFDSVVAKRILDLAFSMLAYFMRTGNIPDDSIPGLMHQLIIIALDSCPWRSLQKGIESGRWFQLMKHNASSDDSNMLTDREILYACAGSISSSKVLKLLTAYCLHLYAVDLKSFSYYLDEEDLNLLLHKHEFQIVELVQKVVEEENENIALHLVFMLHWLGLHSDVITERAHGDSELVVKTIPLANVCMHKLLKKLTVSRNLDTRFGSAILHHFPKEEACKWMLESMRSYKFDFHRLCALTELGLVYFQHIQHEDKWNECYARRKRCTWGKQIAEYGISYKEAFRESSEEQRLLLQKLMLVPSISITLFSKYCRDMNFNFQACLKAYLKQTLIAWQPEYEVKISAMTGEKEIIIKNTQKLLLHKCREIISLIENRQELSDVMSSSIWDSVNYYYYEVYLVMLTLMEENVAQPAMGIFSTYRHVFLFLSTYQRITKPLEYEKEQWYQLHPNTHQPLPPISEHRLPFKLIFARFTKSNSDPWKIIRPELTIRTYSKWFTVLDALELDKNTLCTFAIHQMTSERALTEDPEVKWCVHSRHKKLLLDVQACIENIESLEMASASLYFVMNHLPPGADQVTAAKLCYFQAKKWLDAEPSDKATAGFKKCCGKYLTISTTHILYVHELGKAQYLQLAQKPVELINALYNDPIILERNSENVLNFPDINKTAAEISKLHKLDLPKIKFDLLEEWLLPENFMANVSFGESPYRLEGDNPLRDKFSTVDHENFLKACYIVEGDVPGLGTYLVQIAFDRNTDDSKPINVRLRALRCLFAVASEDALEQITGSVMDKLRDHMSRLEFVSELETLGLTYTFASFTSCNKSEIVRTVLTLKNKTAVRLATRMSRYFDIQSDVIWSNILTKMCSLEMIQDLMDVLPQLANIYHTLDIKILERSWNMVLITPLEKTPSSPSDDQLKSVKEAVKLIQSCPIIDEINVEMIRENCARIGLLNMITDIDGLKF